MDKLRTDSSLHGLTPEQQALLDAWLFDECLPYLKVREQVKQQFGVEVSVDCIGRYYRRVSRARVVLDMVEAEQAALELNGTATRLEGLKSSALKVMGKTFLEKALIGGEVKELAALARLLFEQENREIQRSRVELAKERFELQALQTMLKQKINFRGKDWDDVQIECEWIQEIKNRLLGREPKDMEYEAE